MSRAEQLAQLETMVAAYKHNHNRLAKIAGDMRRKAEAITVQARPKVRQYGRNKATWTGADEDYYLARFFELQETRSREISALKHKLQRQRRAIEQIVSKLGLNDGPKLRNAPVVHPGLFIRR